MSASPYAALLLILAFSINGGCGKSADKAIADGDAYTKNGQYADAVLQYKKALQLEPSSAEAYHRLGIAEWKQKNGTGAWDALKAASSLGNTSPEIMKLRLEIGIAAVLSTARQSEQLQDELHRIADSLLQKEPRAFEAFRAKGYLALTAGDDPGALSWFEKAGAAKPDDEEMLVTLVQSLYRNGQWKQAVSLTGDALRKQPKLTALYNVLYRHHMGAGRKKEALELVRHRLAAQPADAEGYLQLARYWASGDDLRQETAAIDQLLAAERSIPDARLKAGEYQLSRGRAKEAAAIYAGGTGKNYLALQAGALAQAGRTAEAEGVYNTILAQNPDDADSLVNRAVLRMSMGQESKVREAIAGLEAGLAKNADLPRARYQIGRAYVQLGDLAEAQRQWKLVTPRSPDYKEARIALARMAIEAGNPREALAAADAAVSAAPGDPAALLAKAESLQGLGELDQAAAILEPLSDANPGLRRSADLNLALIEIVRGHLSKAERLLAAHAAERDRDLRWLEASSALLLARQEPQAAVQLLRDAVAKNQGSVYLRRVYAQTAARAGQYAAAIEQYRRLVDGAPKEPGLRLRLSEVLWRSGAMAEAEKEAAVAISLAPGDAAARAAHGYVLAAAERHAEAEGAFREAVRIESRNGQYWNNLAWSQVRQGKTEESRKSAGQARSLAPEDFDVIDTLGWIQLQSGDKAGAVRTFRELTAKQAGNPVYRYHLAEALLSNGDKAAAMTERLEAGRKLKAVPAECTNLLTNGH